MADLRVIPAIEQLRQRDAMRALEARYGRAALVDALRAETAALRDRLASGGLAAIAVDDAVFEIERGAESRLRAAMRPSLVGVINATGVIVHTNLGRAPLSAAAAARVADVAAGYTNLEYDLEAGARGRRDTHAERLLQRLTGAEAAVVVNNNAAAAMLTLAALAAGREVIISRGELVEIGGGFRVPDVMAQSGAILREIGTTNRTRAADYAAAITGRTALILRVHPSNFRISGFTERPSLEDLVAIGRRFGVAVAEDLGSGWLGWPERDRTPPPLADEPIVSASVEAGADVVTFSGDKLLGGPQAGIIAGRREPLDRIRLHPLMRAFRVDKLTYAALEATLEQHAIGRGCEEVPVVRMIALTAEEIGRRAEALASALRGTPWRTRLVDGESTIGGGSAPGSALPTRLLELTRDDLTADQIEQRLRALDPPVIARIENDRVVLDLRTVLPQDDAKLRELLRHSAVPSP
ncbi:MAG: L-seryl-tRNA(Sec) selenium transferase [Acidobacteria bacterium]|nr:MAG: L-seryl-tRNA(Sec) selenium transferase [Acidobacteriota bacterium]